MYVFLNVGNLIYGLTEAEIEWLQSGVAVPNTCQPKKPTRHTPSSRTIRNREARWRRRWVDPYVREAYAGYKKNRDAGTARKTRTHGAAKFSAPTQPHQSAGKNEASSHGRAATQRRCRPTHRRHERDPVGGTSALNIAPRDVCLVLALRSLGYPVPVDRSGPFRALADGNSMLAGFGRGLRPVERTQVRAGDYVMWHGGHFVGVRATTVVTIFDNSVPRVADSVHALTSLESGLFFGSSHQAAVQASHQILSVEHNRSSRCHLLRTRGRTTVTVRPPAAWGARQAQQLHLLHMVRRLHRNSSTG